MEAARLARVFLPLPPPPLVLLPLPPRAPLLLPARLPPRAMSEEEHEEVVRWMARIYGWMKKGKKAAREMGLFMARSPSAIKNRVIKLCADPRFPDPRVLVERLASRADALMLAAVLGAALLLYAAARWAAAADYAEEEEGGDAEGITRTGRLPPSTRRHLMLLTLPLVPRGPAAGARRPPWAWSLAMRFDGNPAAALHSPQDLAFPRSNGRAAAGRVFLAGRHASAQQHVFFQDRQHPLLTGCHARSLQRLVLF